MEFSFVEEESYKALQCEIFNRPVENRILRLLGVRRAVAEDVVASFELREAGTQRVVVLGVVPEIVTYTGAAAQRVRLPSSRLPGNFAVVIWDNTSRKVTPGARGITQVIAAGQYVARVAVAKERKSISFQREFAVGDTRRSLFWVVPASKSKKGTSEE